MEKKTLVLSRLASPALPLLLALTAGSALAQRGGGDWMTSGFDAQRSFWVRNDGKISRDSLAKPGFELVWKVKPANTPRQLNSLTTPSLIDFFIGPRGFRALAFFGASNDRFIGYDSDLARVEWENNYGAKGTPPAGTLACPGGLTAAPTRATGLNYPPVPTGVSGGRGTPAKSGVGEPYEGAVTLKRAPAPRPVAPPKPAPAAAAAPNPFAARVQYVHALTGDGKFHSVYLPTGDEPNPGVSFLPAGANAHGLVVTDKVAYVATSNSCSGVANGVWALDIDSKAVTSWKAPANVAGNVGPAIAPDATLYVAAGSELTALAPKTLSAKGTYKSTVGDFTSSPVVFEFKGKNLVAATSAQGHLHVVDTENLAKPFAQSSAFITPGYPVGGVASWQDPAGNRWLLVPAGKNITAFKLVGEGKLEQAWTSPELVSPLTPIVVNGVVFALSSGKAEGKDAKSIIARSVPAVLHALDSATGKSLWNSGKTITSFVTSGGLAAGGSRVYVGAYDGQQYAFSFPIEH